MRSQADRFGDRCRERFTIRGWCLRRSDSATMPVQLPILSVLNAPRPTRSRLCFRIPDRLLATKTRGPPQPVGRQKTILHATSRPLFRASPKSPPPSSCFRLRPKPNLAANRQNHTRRQALARLYCRNSGTGTGIGSNLLTMHILRRSHLVLAAGTTRYNSAMCTSNYPPPKQLQPLGVRSVRHHVNRHRHASDSANSLQ
jgi:hypothetical protein